MNRYPEQCLWWIVGSVKSTQRERTKLCQAVLDRARAIDGRLDAPIKDCVKLVDQLLHVCAYDVGDQRDITIAASVPGLARALPSTMLIPLQASMIPSFPPAGAGDLQSHQPFDATQPTLHGACAPSLVHDSTVR